MSDEEELMYVKKQSTIHYGSIEEQERARLQAAPLVPPGEENMEELPSSPKTEPEALGNVHTSDGNDQ